MKLIIWDDQVYFLLENQTSDLEAFLTDWFQLLVYIQQTHTTGIKVNIY